MPWRRMSIEEKILTLLYQPRYKYMGVSFDELDNLMNPYKRQSVANALSKLSKKEFIKRNAGSIQILSSGCNHLQSKVDRLQMFESPFLKTVKKNQLVLFDIPQTKKAEREWFRLHLKRFGYIMVQRSVWLGPAPLPKNFLDYIKLVGLEPYIKMFILAEDQQKSLKEK